MYLYLITYQYVIIENFSHAAAVMTDVTMVTVIIIEVIYDKSTTSAAATIVLAYYGPIMYDLGPSLLRLG